MKKTSRYVRTISSSRKGWGLHTVLGQLAMIRAQCQTIINHPEITPAITTEVSRMLDHTYGIDRLVREEMERKKKKCR